MRQRISPEEVKAIRTAQGMSQEDFAREVGASVFTVCRWERGVSTPSRLAERAMRAVAAKARRRTA
jgi:DNA-binding transcriptional regulator YiaG